LGNKLNFYFSLNGFVIDREKNPINWASIKIYDRDNTLVYTTTTNASWAITKVDILTMDIRPDTVGTTASNRLPYDHEYRWPFTFVVEKSWFETYSITMDLNKKIDQFFTLKPSKEVIQTTDWEFIHSSQPELWTESVFALL
jgi:hypothetical protein